MSDMETDFEHVRRARLVIDCENSNSIIRGFHSNRISECESISDFFSFLVSSVKQRFFFPRGTLTLRRGAKGKKKTLKHATFKWFRDFLPPLSADIYRGL